MRIALFALLALSACDEAAPPAAGPDAGGDVAMKSAAARECAAMTGYSPEKLKTQTAEMQALVTREYQSCVEQVTRGK